MAVSLVKSCVVASFMVVMLLCITTATSTSARTSGSMKASGPDLNAICSKTRNPTFCLSVLNSAPGVSKADLPGLCTIIIDIATSNASNTLEKIKLLLKQATDPKLETLLSSCSQHYDMAIGDLQDAKEKLAAGDNQGVNLEASAAMDNANNCQDEVGAVSTALAKNNEDLQSISSIILVISNMLRRP